MATSFNTLRVSFLEQAAKLMNEHSADVTDSYATLSRIYIKELREVCNVEQIRMHKDFKRTVCKRCQRIWLPTSNFSTLPFRLKKSRGKNFWLICSGCSSRKHLVADPKYTSRNEKAQMHLLNRKQTNENDQVPHR